MPMRDDREALRSRLDSLERELAELREERDRLRARASEHSTLEARAAQSDLEAEKLRRVLADYAGIPTPRARLWFGISAALVAVVVTAIVILGLAQAAWLESDRRNGQLCYDQTERERERAELCRRELGRLRAERRSAETARD